MKAHWKLLFVIVAIAMLLLPLGLRASEPVKAWAAHEQRLTAVEKELADAKARIAALEKAALEKAATALAAPPAACPCPGAAAPATTAPAAAAGHSAAYDPYRLVSYQAVMDAVSAGQTVRMYIRVPDMSIGSYRPHYHTDGFPEETAGAYDCRLENGSPVMRPVTTVVAAQPTSAPVHFTAQPVILRGQTCPGGVCYGSR